MEGGAKSLQQITNRKPADARGVQFVKSGFSTEHALPCRRVSDTLARMGVGMYGIAPPIMCGLPNAFSVHEPITCRRPAVSDNASEMSDKRVLTSNHIEDWHTLGELHTTMLPTVLVTNFVHKSSGFAMSCRSAAKSVCLIFYVWKRPQGHHDCR